MYFKGHLIAKWGFYFKEGMGWVYLWFTLLAHPFDRSIYKSVLLQYVKKLCWFKKSTLMTKLFSLDCLNSCKLEQMKHNLF